MRTFGEIIKEFREKEQLPQRKVAHEIDVDVAVLSKIENENKVPKKRVSQIIDSLSGLMDIPKTQLEREYLADEIADLISDREDHSRILEVAEEKIKYLRSKRVVQSRLNF